LLSLCEVKKPAAPVAAVEVDPDYADMLQVAPLTPRTPRSPRTPRLKDRGESKEKKEKKEKKDKKSTLKRSVSKTDISVRVATMKLLINL
jgi:hypothetical protein